MQDQQKFKKQLLTELEWLRRRVAMLEPLKFKLKQVKSALRDAEARFKTLFNQAPVPLYILRIDGSLADSNAAAVELTGYTADECIGLDFIGLRLLKGEDLVTADHNIKRNRSGEPTGPDVFTIYPKNRGPVSAEFRAHPINIRIDRFVLNIIRDISEQKKSESGIS